MRRWEEVQVGAGKSSLLAALLGEIRRVSGSVSMNGRVAYTAQVKRTEVTQEKKTVWMRVQETFIYM